MPTEVKVTTRATGDDEVKQFFDLIFPDEWPVLAIRVAATLRAYRELAEEAKDRIIALQNLVRWSMDTEDVDFYAQENPKETQAIALAQEIVLGIARPE